MKTHVHAKGKLFSLDPDIKYDNYYSLCACEYISHTGSKHPLVFVPGAVHADTNTPRMTIDHNKDPVTCPTCLVMLNASQASAKDTRVVHAQGAILHPDAIEAWYHSLCNNGYTDARGNFVRWLHKLGSKDHWLDHLTAGRMTADGTKDPVTCKECLKLMPSVSVSALYRGVTPCEIHTMNRITLRCTRCGISELEISRSFKAMPDDPPSEGMGSFLSSVKGFKHNRSLKGNVNVPLLMVDDPEGNDVAD